MLVAALLPHTSNMPTNDNIIVGIDVGTHKVCTIVAEADGGPVTGGRLNVLGVGAVASEGISRGMITDIVKATKAVSHSLEAAERQSGCRILSAYVSASGSHIASSNSRGLVSVSNPDRIIGQDDVSRAVDAARAIDLPSDRDLLHVIPRAFTVDGQEGIRNPVGLSGFRLEVETHVVTAASTTRETLIRCVQQADVEVDDLVLSPLASAEAVLSEQEKSLGVVLVDIGHGTTDISIYVEGSVLHTKVIPIGGWHLTNDLVIVCNIPYEAAEALKLQYGQAVLPGAARQPRPAQSSSNGKTQPPIATVQARSNGTYANGTHSNGTAFSPLSRNVSLAIGQPDDDGYTEQSEDDEMIEAQTFEGSTRLVRRAELNEVMAARLDQLFTMIGEEIRRSGYDGLLAAGAVLTGGVALMPKLESFAAHKLRMPVRVGRPQRVGGLGAAFEHPSYATSVGLVMWGLQHGPQATISSRFPKLGRRSSSFESRGTSLAKWLRGFLPHG